MLRTFISRCFDKALKLSVTNISFYSSLSPSLRSAEDCAVKLKQNMDENQSVLIPSDKFCPEAFSVATVQDIADMSPTVKSLTLKIHSERLSFKPGQWIDFYVPGIDSVAGFSMCSSPSYLRSTGCLKLAVKCSDHPITTWVHTKCRANSRVEVQVGGTYYYDREPSNPLVSLLLIGGGVGINPLSSILHHVTDMNQPQARVALLYSAQTKDELLFKDTILSISSNCDNVRCRFFVTREKIDENIKEPITADHIQSRDLEDSLSWLQSAGLPVHSYLCGPLPMVTGMEESLLKLGLPTDSIHYEKW